MSGLVRQNPQLSTIGDKPIENAANANSLIQFQGIGSSGIRNFAGYISEDYLHSLHGHVAADIYDKMRRSDSKIKKVLKAVKDPIMAANWEVQAAGDDADATMHRDFIEHVLFEGLADENNFAQFVREALTALDFGHSVFEKIHKVVLNHPEFGDYIGIQKIAWRSPRTIHKFNIDPETESLKSVTQFAYGDAARPGIDIDAKFLMIITIDREGSNWEGISYLRNCYGAWLRKQTYLKLLAIGIEKYAIPTPIGKVPVQAGPDYDAFIEALDKYTSHETNYITLPAGWDITLQQSNFDAAKIMAAVQAENMEIVDAFIANFLELAMGSGGGSRALSEDMSAFFLSGITQLANIVVDAVNAKLIKDLIDLKFGVQQKYPKLNVSGITDKAGIDLANALKALVDSKVIIPDDKLEDNVRKRFDFPEASKIGQRQVTPPGGGASPGPGNSPFQSAGLSERQINLAEKTAKHLISSGSDLIKECFQKNLTVMGARLIADLMKAARGLSSANKLAAIKKVDVVGLGNYRTELTAVVSKVARMGIDSARKDVPKARNVKFDEAYYDDLPPEIQKIVDAQIELLIGTQESDLKKAVLFQYNSSAPSTDSEDMIAADLNDALEKYVDGVSVDTGATITSAEIVNKSRMSFFEQPDVADQIDAFQFVNGDPVSPICKDLAGRIFDINDPINARYMAPLHHNCKSYIMPILAGNLGNKEITNLVPSNSSLEKYITLSEAKLGGPGSGRKGGKGKKSSPKFLAME